jgi:hypothetical protein
MTMQEISETPCGLGDLPQAVAFDDGPVGVDQDRPA